MEENTETVRQAPPPEADTTGKVPPNPAGEPVAAPVAPEADNAGNTPGSDKPAAPKRPGGGAGLAVTATVIIVLALAAMATYAFIKTQN